MWINKQLFDMVLQDNKNLSERCIHFSDIASQGQTWATASQMQKVKDDATIDWLRNRCNALEKERAVLLNKVAGIYLPVPEIVPSRPGTMAPSFDSMPSFEDVGEDEAQRLGIGHEEDGTLKFTKE